MKRKKEEIPVGMIAYSYVRWSHPDQKKGDSLTRQLLATRHICQQKGWVLDETKEWIDSGVSSFRGDNVEKGALGAFIMNVETGAIRTPCVLVVEQLDRVTRQNIRAARNLFESLLEKNVNICIATTGKIYTKESLENLNDLILSLVELNAGYIYAKNLGERVSAAWERKRNLALEKRVPLSKTCPHWLRLERKGQRWEDCKYVVIRERVKIIRRIFKEYVTGFGYHAIAKKLNDEKVPPIGYSKTWNHSYIASILQSRAVLGEYEVKKTVGGKVQKTGETIANYFPPIISFELFEKARERKKLSGGFRAKNRRTLRNLLGGIAKCALCGSGMTFAMSGSHPALVCRRGARGSCLHRTIHMRPVEGAVIAICATQLIPLVRKEATKPNAAYEKLLKEKAKVERQIKEYSRIIDESAEKVPKLIVQKLYEAEQRLEAITGEIQDKRPTSDVSLNEVEKTFSDFLLNQNDLELRVKARTALSFLLSSVEMNNSEGIATVRTKQGNEVTFSVKTTKRSSFPICYDIYISWESFELWEKQQGAANRVVDLIEEGSTQAKFRFMLNPFPFLGGRKPRASTPPNVFLGKSPRD